MLHLQQFAAMNILYSRYSLDYFLRSTAEMGFRNIEFWGSIPHYDIFAESMGQQKAIREKLAEYDLKMVCFTPEQCVYPFNIAARESNLRRKSIDFFSRCLSDAAGFGTEKMLLTPGWGNYEEPAEEAWKRSLDSTDQLIRIAEREGVTICYEILQPFESNLVTDLPSLKRVMDTFPSRNLAICVDTVPVTCNGETLAQYIQTFGERIRHIHLNDGLPSGHMAWGDGSQDLAAHLRALREYDGYITFETADSAYALDPNKAFEKDLAAVRQFFRNGRFVL